METELKRTGDWHFSDIAVLDSGGANITHGYCRAVFNVVDKSGPSEEIEIHRIIYNKNTLNVLWADFGNYSNSDLIEENEKEDIFISHNDYIYRFEYLTTDIWLIKTPDSQRTKLENTDDETLDKYIRAFCEENDHGFWSDMPYSKYANIAACLGESFFRKGLKWKYGSHFEYKGKTVTKLKCLCAENNLFKIIIENGTFIKPKTEVVYLDIEKFEISDGKNKILMEDYEGPIIWGMYIPKGRRMQ
jgi:hypothetical protein